MPRIREACGFHDLGRAPGFLNPASRLSARTTEWSEEVSMAAKKNLKSAQPDSSSDEQSLNDLERLYKYVLENPKQVAVIAGVVVLCIVATVLYRISSRAADHAVMTEYAAAMTTIEDPAERVRALGNLLDRGAGRWEEEVTYMMGESAIQAKEYDKAREILSRVLTEFPQSEFAPRAAEGIAFLDENAGKNEEALKSYQEIKDKWKDTLTGKLQPLNIARVYESMGSIDKAIAAYNEEKQVFPDSSAARKADFELRRLKEAHPDLFPKEEEKPAAPATSVPAGTVVVPAPAPAPSATPATPATPAPAEPAAPTAPTPAPAESTAPAAPISPAPTPAPAEPATPEAPAAAAPAPAEQAAPAAPESAPEPAPEPTEQPADPAAK